MINGMKNSELAEKAAELIRTKGWKQGTYGNDIVGYCLVGAVRQAANLEYTTITDSSPDKLAAGVVIPGMPENFMLSYGCGCDTCKGILDSKIIHYNDSDGTDERDVLDVLDRAAKHWRNQGE